METTVTVLIILSTTYHCGGQTFNGDGLAEAFEKFANEAMGVTYLQNYYDNIAYTRTSINGDDLVQELTFNIGQKFYYLREAALKIKDAVEANHQAFPGKIDNTNMENCCLVTGVNSSLKFQTQVSENAACLTVSPKSPDTKRFPDNTIEAVMKQNYVANPNLLWQYFGSEDGTSILYPKAKVTPLCSSFDPRYQPYYTSAATPIAKDIVIVLDTSTSMHTTDNSGRTRMRLAKNVATTVIQTLNRNDRMAVVSFDTTALKPTMGCYSSQLSLHTTENDKVLTTFINNLNIHEGSDYSQGLEAAFQYFIDSPAPEANEERYQVILFLSDGTDPVSTSGKHPLDVIRDENEKLGNRVYIMTYGLGNEIGYDDYSLSLLRNMSLQNRNDVTAGEIMTGFSELIEDSNNLRSKIGRYYSFFKKDTISNDPLFSVPFLDTFSGIGVLISVCLPAYDTNSNQHVLLGVACADIKLSDLFSEVTVFPEGDSAYVFIIDKNGRTLKHPLLPLPRTVKNSYTLHDISYLERAHGTDQVIAAMKRGETGNVHVSDSTKTMARGVVLKEGILTRIGQATYHYAPVAHSDYCLCVVVGDGYELTTLPPQTPRPGVFVYHRRDLIKDDLTNCKYYARMATNNHSTIKLNVNAFMDPADYLYREDTPITVNSYNDFFAAKTKINPGLKPELVNSVIVSYKAEEFWKANQHLALYIVWRHIGTKDGFIRLYPGASLKADYDHEIRPWWRRTMAQRGNLVVTTPYIDAWGAGWMVTLCHTLYTGRENGIHTDSDEVGAILGTDVGLSYLYHLLLKTYPTCEDYDNTCMLVDNSGFIVMHPKFVDPSVDDSKRREIIEDIHIVHQESDLARDLLSKGVMSKQSCADFDNHKLQFTYRIQLNDGDNNVKGDNYELWAVRKTNLFVIKKNTAEVVYQCCLDKTMVSPDLKLCTERSCDCLCYDPIPFDSCTDSIREDKTASTCIVKTPDSTTTIPPDNIDGLNNCFNANCDTRTEDIECYSVGACSWCARDQTTPLSNPCCRGVDTCLFGVVLSGKRVIMTGATCGTGDAHSSGQPDLIFGFCKGDVCPIPTPSPTTPPTTTMTYREEDKLEVVTNVIVGGCMGAVILTLIIISVIIYRRHIRSSKRNPADDYITPIPALGDGLDGIGNPQYAVAGVSNTSFVGNPPPYDTGPYRHDHAPKYHVAANQDRSTVITYHAMPGSTSNSSGSAGSTSNNPGSK